MKATLRKILKAVGVIWFIALFIAAFFAYFITSSGPDGMTDGLGRQLVETPLFVRFFLGQERLWAGFIWHIIDMIVFFGSILVATAIGKWVE
jgi:hypothetical protein